MVCCRLAYQENICHIGIVIIVLATSLAPRSMERPKATRSEKDRLLYDPILKDPDLRCGSRVNAHCSFHLQL